MSEISPPRPDLLAHLRERILVLDGATGSMYQGYGLDEADYRGERFADIDQDVVNAWIHQLVSVGATRLIRSPGSMPATSSTRSGLRRPVVTIRFSGCPPLTTNTCALSASP